MDKKFLALFDLDGTLFETGDVNYYAYKDALKPYGFGLDKDYFIRKCNGRHYTEFLPQIMGTSDYLEEVHNAKKTAYAANLDRAVKNGHLFEIIGCLRGRYHTAIVTTASRHNTLEILSFFECEKLFDYLVTQEDVEKVKPDPQGFFVAMRYFGLMPQDTIIFEDSDVGIQAAMATGATVVSMRQFAHPFHEG